MADDSTTGAGALEYRFTADWSQWEGAIGRAQNKLDGFGTQNQKIAQDASRHWEASGTRIRDAMLTSLAGMSSSSVSHFTKMSLQAAAAATVIDKLLATLERVSEPIKRAQAQVLHKTLFDSGLWAGIVDGIAAAADKLEVFAKLAERAIGMSGDRNVSQFDAAAKSVGEVSQGIGKMVAEAVSAVPALKQLADEVERMDKEMGTKTWGKAVREIAAQAEGAVAATAGIKTGDLNNNPTKRVYSDIEAYRRLEAQLQRNVELQELEGLALGMSAGEAARLRAQSELLAATKGRNIILSEEQRAKLLALIEAEGQAADRAALLKYQKALTDAGRDQVAALRLEADTMGRSEEQVARLTFAQQQLLDAQRQNIPVTDELRQRIMSQADAVGEATKRLQDQKRTFDTFAAAGDQLRSSTENAFSNWLKTGRFSWKEFEREILTGIATIAVRAAMLRPLFGDNGGGGVWGGIAGAASRWWNGGGDVGTGSWAPTVSIDGARAGGGPVWRGGKFLVGENGPEVVEFGASGNVVPNGGTGASPTVNVAPPNVQVNVTAPPGTTARETGRSQTADGGFRIDLMIEQFDAAIGRMIGDGRSSVGAALAARHGLGAAVGAR